MRRGPISRGAFDGTLHIVRSSLESSPYYTEAERKVAAHIIETIENGVLTLAGLRK